MTEKENIINCKIAAGKDHPHVWRRINKLVTMERADYAKVYAMRCRTCKTIWDDCELVDPLFVACSNCYSDNVEIVKLKMIVMYSDAQEKTK
jgi:hypothetical protein